MLCLSSDAHVVNTHAYKFLCLVPPEPWPDSLRPLPQLNMAREFRVHSDFNSESALQRLTVRVVGHNADCLTWQAKCTDAV